MRVRKWAGEFKEGMEKEKRSVWERVRRVQV